jgi:hypothetical protein
MGIGELVPSGEVQRFQRSTQSRPQVLLGSQHSAKNLELLIGQLYDPHGCPLHSVSRTIGS